MREFIDEYAVANTVRMMGAVRAGARAALTEEDSVTRRLTALAEPGSVYVVPAHSRENLLGALRILSGERWRFTCTSLGAPVAPPPDVPNVLRGLPWVSEAWKHAPEPDDDKSGLVVVSPGEGGEAPRGVAGAARAGLGDQWKAMNARRISLIRKQVRQGLTAAEEEDLNRLQAGVRRQLNAAYPLPFDKLNRAGGRGDES